MICGAAHGGGVGSSSGRRHNWDLARRQCRSNPCELFGRPGRAELEGCSGEGGGVTNVYENCGHYCKQTQT